MEKANLNRNTNGLSSQGKLILLVLIVVGLMAGGYLFYTGNNKTQKPQENISNLPTLEEMSIEKEKKLRNATEEIEINLDHNECGIHIHTGSAFTIDAKKTTITSGIIQAPTLILNFVNGIKSSVSPLR